jgi:hypothetical protein
MPCKIIASITRSITNRTLLMHIVNLFLRIPLFGVAEVLAMGLGCGGNFQYCSTESEF